jgi:hypothetical protein
MPPEEFDTLSTQHDPPELEHCGAEGRALVTLPSVDQSPPRVAGYGSAPFLAQLVATKDQHPQTRERRRAEPEMASAAYRAAAALTAA